MTLAEYRKKWERGGLVICTTVKQYTDGYKTVHAVIEYPDNSYSLHRYYKLGEEWVVSADLQNTTLKECLEVMSEVFDEIYPTE